MSVAEVNRGVAGFIGWNERSAVSFPFDPTANSYLRTPDSGSDEAAQVLFIVVASAVY